MSAFFPRSMFYQIFGPQDWAILFIKSDFCSDSFYTLYLNWPDKVLFKDQTLSLISVVLLEGQFISLILLHQSLM